jgi:hypothetical protein
MHTERRTTQKELLVAFELSDFLRWPAIAVSLLLLLSVVSGTAAEADAAQVRSARTTNVLIAGHLFEYVLMAVFGPTDVN